MDADKPQEIVELEELYGRLLAVAGVELPSKTREVFEALVEAANGAEIRHLLSSERRSSQGSASRRDWHHILQGSLVDTRYGLGAANYHLENI